MNTAPPPQAPYYPMPPKKHTGRTVLIVLGILTVVFLLVMGGCLALLGGAANEIDKSLTEEEANDTPSTLDEGKAFTHDDFEVAAGWRVVQDRLFGGATLKGLQVTNGADERRSAQFTFTLIRGKTNLAEIECDSRQLQPGQSSSMDCISLETGFPKGWEEIRVADMW